MMENNIPVAFLPAAIDACALYRQFIPHLHLPGSRFLLRFGALNVQELDGCKVCVVQRSVSEHNRIAIQRMKAIGMKIVYDLDDDIWNLPPWNPGKETFDSLQEGFKMCAAEADLLTVSTRGLKSAAEKGFKFNKEVLIVPNSICFNLFSKKNLTKDDTVVIGWQGSNTHSEDCREVFDMLPDILDKNPQARMNVCGAPLVDLVEEFEPGIINGKIAYRKVTMQVSNKLGLHKHVLHRNWVPVGEYPNRFASWGWDIALAPLANHKFNWSKSNIKMLEAAAIRIPCLASDIQPYNEFASLGGSDLKWLLCSFASQWKDKLRVLINEPERREYLGQKMYEVAKTFYDASVIKNTWQYAFQKALVS